MIVPIWFNFTEGCFTFNGSVADKWFWLGDYVARYDLVQALLDPDPSIDAILMYGSLL